MLNEFGICVRIYLFGIRFKKKKDFFFLDYSRGLFAMLNEFGYIVFAFIFDMRREKKLERKLFIIQGSFAVLHEFG